MLVSDSQYHLQTVGRSRAGEGENCQLGAPGGGYGGCVGDIVVAGGRAGGEGGQGGSLGLDYYGVVELEGS